MSGTLRGYIYCITSASKQYKTPVNRSFLTVLDLWINTSLKKACLDRIYKDELKFENNLLGDRDLCIFCFRIDNQKSKDGNTFREMNEFVIVVKIKLGTNITMSKNEAVQSSDGYGYGIFTMSVCLSVCLWIFVSGPYLVFIGSLQTCP